MTGLPVRFLLFSSLLSTESVNMDQKRSHVEAGSTPEKRRAKTLTPTGSSKRNLFSSPSSGEPVSKLFFFQFYNCGKLESHCDKTLRIVENTELFMNCIYKEIRFVFGSVGDKYSAICVLIGYPIAYSCHPLLSLFQSSCHT